MSERNKVYVISDAHLFQSDDPVVKERHAKLRSFFNAIRNEAKALYIVGDYFDFHFNYRQAVPKQNILGLHWLLDLIDHGVTIDYLAGNHDYWSAKTYEPFGIHFHEKPFTVVLGGKNVHFIHGDGLSELDRRYRIMRRILRFPMNIRLFRWLHPDLGITLANRMSHFSKQQDRDYLKYRDDKSYFKHINEIFDSGADIIVMGHHHIPAEIPFGSKRYYNIGDWINHFTYLEIDGDNFSLKSWVS